MQESSRIEFKRQLTDSLEKEIVAFLNSPKGGEIYIGVNDTTQQAIKLGDLDSLEITSTGSLPEGMDKDDFFSGISHPQNKVLMRMFRDLEKVEHLGSGVPRILQHYSKDSYVFLSNFTRIVLPYVEGFIKSLTKTDQATPQA